MKLFFGRSHRCGFHYKNVSDAEINKPGYCIWVLIGGLFHFVIQMNVE
ncbi:hypothetical protein CKO_04244 [Citrobacter koseri ATCC BAA-895]|uniref:Uncharacterized protein n=1 Tax=Citrobacter koseri (strain ATCC BAA-895 / CDC 4225-83 / SGSC4696) TaxID=290338 RepID=A8AP90_CITK8|nr:hypothetical protein CKO_04244 [Citrobacter koseri ATCC BAA-895]